MKLFCFKKDIYITLLENNVKEKNYLTEYKCSKILETPYTEMELYEKYKSNIVPFLEYYVSVMGEPSFEITNEIRAMFGHITDYRLSANDVLKKNLEKAYGHLRRVSLDISKILCDEYDKIFSSIIKKLYKYDYRKCSDNFLRRYLELYFEARECYLHAQNEEKLGSNNNTAYYAYFNALQKYIDLKNHYLKYKKTIEKQRRKAIIGKSVSVVVSILLLVVNIISIF